MLHNSRPKLLLLTIVNHEHSSHRRLQNHIKGSAPHQSSRASLHLNPPPNNKQGIVSVNVSICSLAKHFLLGSYDLFQYWTGYVSQIVICAIVNFQNNGIWLVEWTCVVMESKPWIVIYVTNRFERKLVIRVRGSSSMYNWTRFRFKTCFPLDSLWAVLYRRRTKRHSVRKRWRSKWARWVFWGANRYSKLQSFPHCPYVQGGQLASGSALRFLRIAISIQYPNRSRRVKTEGQCQTAREKKK